MQRHKHLSYANREEIKIPAVQEKLKANLEKEFGATLLSAPDLAWKEYGLCYFVASEKALECFQKLRSGDVFHFNMLVDVTAVDWLDKKEPRYEVVYQLLSTTYNHRLCIKIQATEEKPEVPSVVGIWKSANFLEREVWDMYGIVFKDHGDLRRILMYDEFVGHPLRKDYPIRGKQPRVQMRLPELHNTAQDMQREQLVSLPVRQRMYDTE
jgi:NADH-quinone oxidoreductase subunit C